MTLVIAAQGKDFLVLGTDSKGTIQDIATNRIELNIEIKFVKITKRVGILMYGAAYEAGYIIDKFKKTVKVQNRGVTKIAEDLAALCIKEAEKVMDVPTPSFPHYGFIIAGLDKSGNKYTPHCYRLTSSAGFRLGLYQRRFAIEGKPIIAYYMFARDYQKNMSVDDLCKLVAQSIFDTMNMDGDVGGKIKMLIIDDSGIRERSDGDIAASIKEWSN